MKIIDVVQQMRDASEVMGRTFHSNANFISDAIKWLTAKYGDLHMEYHNCEGWHCSTCMEKFEWFKWTEGDGSLESCLANAVMLSSTSDVQVEDPEYFKSLIEQYEAAHNALRQRLTQPSMQAEWVAERVLEWMDELEV